MLSVAISVGYRIVSSYRYRFMGTTVSYHKIREHDDDNDNNIK